MAVEQVAARNRPAIVFAAEHSLLDADARHPLVAEGLVRQAWQLMIPFARQSVVAVRFRRRSAMPPPRSQSRRVRSPWRRLERALTPSPALARNVQ